MENQDSVKLLKECDAGVKMAVSSIDEVLEKVCDHKMKDILQQSKEHHKKLEKQIHSLLAQCGEQDKEPNPMAKGMSWMKTNIKLGMDHSDKTVADLIIDGCNMGVKSLYKYMNQYKQAETKPKEICKELIKIEEKLCGELKEYL